MFLKWNFLGRFEELKLSILKMRLLQIGLKLI